MRSYFSPSLQQPFKAGDRKFFQDPGERLGERAYQVGLLSYRVNPVFPLPRARPVRTDQVMGMRQQEVVAPGDCP